MAKKRGQKRLKYVILDGYNIIHAWPKLKQKLAQSGWESAANALEDAVRVLYDAGFVDCLYIVFDGNGQSVDRIHPFKDPNFTIFYTPTYIQADRYIERLVEELQGADITVASDDQLVRGRGRFWGANDLSAKGFIEWVESMRRTQKERFKREFPETSKKKWRPSPFEGI